MHLIYVFVLIFYITDMYLEAPIDYIEPTDPDLKEDWGSWGRTIKEPEPFYLWTIFACLFYPVFYDGT